jgi:hypothetical protein
MQPFDAKKGNIVVWVINDLRFHRWQRHLPGAPFVQTATIVERPREFTI